MRFLNQTHLNKFFSLLGLAILAVSTINPITTNAKEVVSNAGGPGYFNNFTINNTANDLPVNSTSDGSISICIDDVDQIILIPKNIVYRLGNFPIGNHTYKITSFTKSSADGSIMNPCQVVIDEPDLILSEGTMNIEAGKRYELNFSGTATPDDPRNYSTFYTQTPTVKNLTSPGSDGTGLFISYPDSKTALYLNKQVCISDDINPATLITGSYSLSGRIHFDIPLDSGVTVFPPTLAGDCSNPNPSTHIQSNVGTVSSFVYFSGAKFTGLSTEFVEMVIPEGQGQSYIGGVEDKVFSITDPSQGLFKDSTYAKPMFSWIYEESKQGTVAINESSGTFTFTPNPDFNGDATFSYRLADATDTTKQSPVYTTTISFAPVNDTPTVTSNTLNFEVSKNQVFQDTAKSLTKIASDVDSNLLTPIAKTQPKNGTLEILSDGNFKYTPNKDFVGTDSFTYTVSDNNLTTIEPNSNIVSNSESEIITVNIKVSENAATININNTNTSTVNSTTSTNTTTLAKTGSELSFFGLVAFGLISLGGLVLLVFTPKFKKS